ncbi:kinase-like protein [Marasmius fiardii PR-910]|nr:kinase-like protein [Marasmius fiardii PR-910]
MGTRRFYSREIVLFLEEFGIEVFPNPLATHRHCKACPGTVNKIEVWCKLVPEREAKTYEKLKPFNSEEHHVATLAVPSLALPIGDHLIVMPLYGTYLQQMIWWSSPELAGPFVHRLARQLCIAVDFLHDHNMYHLDIKPANLAIHRDTCDLTAIDLGWVMSGKQPCYVSGVTGTYDCAPPEVRKWFEWKRSSPRLGRYNPRKSDAWAIGNVIHILLETVSKYGDPYEVTHSDELWDFGCWMMDKRPRMKEALEWLEQIDQKPGARIRGSFFVDRDTSP